ncbi:hypothetical protein LQM11_001209 [Vibrio parahaemolyticus]|nr:hypothetical protein [Vibrio parahaemolyticus]
MTNEIENLKEEIETLKSTIYKMHKELIVHRQHVQQRTVRDLSGYVTIPNLTAATIEQLNDNTILVVQTADGTMRAYLSEIFSKLAASDIPSLDANKITSGVFDRKRIPAAINSSTSGVGFGGFRYTVSGTTLNLFTS